MQNTHSQLANRTTGSVNPRGAGLAASRRASLEQHPSPAREPEPRLRWVKRGRAARMALQDRQVSSRGSPCEQLPLRGAGERGLGDVVRLGCSRPWCPLG